MTNNPTSRVGTLLLIIAIIAGLVVAVMIFGARLNLWEPIVGFGYIRNYLNPIGLTVLGLSMLGFVSQLVTRNRTGIVKTLIATLIGFGLVTPMIQGIISPTKRAPAIHDITTDTITPPEFLVLDETRAGAKNSLIYEGEAVAAIQKKAYPYIQPIESNLTAAEAYKRALEIAQQKGWEIIAKDTDTLYFEATAQTAFFGFMDDIVIRITPINDKSRVDIRSVSRIGRSDKGLNAARIVEFTSNFNQ